MWGDKVCLYSPGWGSDDKPSLFSNREYLVFEVMAARMDDHYGDLRRGGAENMRLYVDTTNGVVTYDVTEYEKSLGLEPEEREGW